MNYYNLVLPTFPVHIKKRLNKNSFLPAYISTTSTNEPKAQHISTTKGLSALRVQITSKDIQEISDDIQRYSCPATYSCTLGADEMD